ncbi:GntR family transcriptional regulator [Helicovermis profundi]|uniref:GntR family transcriptional regulator n=1 Tax=Helicovermis profundi TaxID=3065157 RepID=A0AAU9EHY8_9FIRM|nr:GntR family transcriptional regulator [Clostridia bacterium S502]
MNLERNISLSQKAKIQILDHIKKSAFKVDEILPSEATLVKMLGVSRYTVREALALLEQERIIYKIKGKGTFLNRRPTLIESGLEKLDSITETIRKFGMMPGTKWIGVEVKNPSDDMIEKLKLEEGEKVVTFKRLRTADNNIASYCIDTMPVKYFEHIPYDISEESMFYYLEKELGIYVESAISYIMPTRPSMEMINELDVKIDQLFIMLHQIHFDKSGKPVLYSNDYFNPEIIKFKINRFREER